jgi:CRISPR-associated endonuclease Csn1
MASYTLGLDIGSNSIGWALLRGEGNPGIIDLGVRVFPEGVAKDKGLEKPKNATRREARGARRTHQRRNRRKQQLLSVLQSAGLLPEGDSERRSLFHKNPYELRRKGLDDRLELFEFGRILYHLTQRRGFKSNRKSGKAKEDGVVIKGANALRAEMHQRGCRTIGEYFAGLNCDEQRIRGQYTFRSMYQNEFDLLWAKQEEFYPGLLREDLCRCIRDEIIFFQRPLKPSDELIGQCKLEPDEKRCARGDWYARGFRMLQDLNNLRIQNADGSEDRLTREQRKTLIDELGRKKELTFDKVREKLGLIETQLFNLEQEGKIRALKGDTFAAAMRNRNAFGPKGWDAMDEQQKIDLNTAFVELEDDELAEKLKSQYDLNEKQIESAMKLALARGYMSFSRKAIMKLLPFMEQGHLTSEAIEKAGYSRDKPASEAQASTLPPPPDLRNPIVQKALFEVRKVVNAIVREYGKPARIIIEMARDVQGSREQREELHWKILENEKRNEEARKRLREDIGISNPSRDDGIKYKLWDECGHTCPYTGKHISQTALFGENPEFQVEHILPYDRSLDDSYMNKTLCEVHENIDVKRGQTPFEAYSHDQEKYEQLMERVNKSLMPYPKRKKFWQKEIDLDKHIERELNDTRYICREVVSYLKELGVHVKGSRGKITSELRYQWGLPGVFDELGTRRDDDHRRHAVDAVIVGVTKNEHLRRLARCKYSLSGEAFDPPWGDFREEVREKVAHINVSHRAQRKVSGKLHEETNYGATDKEAVYVFRKGLEDLTLPMVGKIVDPVVREIVQTRLREKGVDLAGSGKPPKDVWKEALYMKTTASDKKVQIKKVRVYNVAKNVIPMKDRSGKAYRYVEPGRNHHIEIFEYTHGDGRVKRDSHVITMFVAVQRSQKGQEVISRDYGDEGKFVCSLAINELVMMKNTMGEMDLYRVQKMDSNKMVRFRHHTASTIDRKETYIDKTAHLFQGEKVTVDPLGRIHPAND